MMKPIINVSLIVYRIQWLYKPEIEFPKPIPTGFDAAMKHESVMSILEKDEFPHDPPAPLHERWQENFFVIAWALDDGVGFLMHCKRWPSTGQQVARLVAAFGQNVVSRRVVEPIPRRNFEVDGLSLEPITPFRELRLTGGFKGTPGFGPLGFVAWRRDGAVPVELDLTLRSELAPADFAAGFEALAGAVAGPGSERPVFEHTQEHYEQGGHCEGFVTIDGERRRLHGLFVRDHTWGRRDESAMSSAGYGFWTASVSADADLFFNATGMVVNGATRGIGVVVDRSGQFTTTDVAVEFKPSAGLRAFDSTRIRIRGDRPITADGQPTLHLVKYLPGSGPGRYDDNAISRISGPGFSGFGVHEYAGTLSPDQAAVLDAAED